MRAADEVTQTGGPDPKAAVPARSTGRERLRRLGRIQELGLVVVLVLLVAYFSAFAPGFDSSENIKTIFIYLSVLGVLSLGQTLVILAGGFDLSNGAVLAFASAIGATMLADGSNQVVAVVATVAVALGIGIINGVLIAVLRVNAFIATLGTFLIFSGAAYVYTNSQTINFPLNEWVVFGRGTLGFMPTPVLILLVLSVMAVLVLRYTVYGRSLYAIGGNSQAARLSGIPVKRYLVIVFGISGLSAGIGALIQASLGSAGSATYTGELNLQSITAVILGGAALTGGEASIVGTLLGVVITQTILDGLTLMNVSEFYQDVVTGIVLLLAVLLANARQALSGRKLRRPGWAGGGHRRSHEKPPPVSTPG
jgi:ribose transport system permease protein